MLWDGVFLVMATILAINGYKRGLLASWRGPIAIVLTTLAVQYIYIDFAAWVAARLRVGPQQAVVVGYLLLWFAIEALLEILLEALLKGGMPKRPGTFNRIAGVGYGLCKAVLIAILPLMAAGVDIKIPEPPPDRSGLVVPQLAAVEGSYLMPGFTAVAHAALPIAGTFVVSTKAPSFKPDYSTPELKSPQDSKQLEKDIDSVLK
jgi:hypothetical protein